MSTDETLIDFTVTFRGNAYPLSLLPDASFADLQARLEELTSVPPSLQKLLFKGKKQSVQDDDTIVQAGLKSGMKVQMLGSTAKEIGGLRATESEYQKRERILRERAAKAPVKVRNTSSPSSSASSQYTFHRIEPLSHLPDPAAARSVLTRLANDPAIRHIMQKNQLSVGILTELAPHEQPHLLGLNVNAGQAIKLRLRTDRYDGFLLYNDVRRVLCHELSHNRWSEHDDNFKEMNSRLNREVAEFERLQREGTHYLSGSGDVYTPSSELEAEAQAYVLGGGPQTLGGTHSGSATDESREERRRRVLEATMHRLRKEEEELEHMCGTATDPSDTV
ncbi:WLM-domain-containing protein [Wolfiporia cocos MD-104 SS10]|uniref:WLM-domain-containing protein n=1 Tax=Wolfiporia cocos (strain MD-104) TaxID=742152 RepID=A0A2H3JCD7_WOLCO|nr:WLM-domain-containing protein [Wolfiporia cocos MD-104 SS10]